MKGKLGTLWIWLLSLTLVCAAPAQAQQVFTPQQQTYPAKTVLQDLARMNVVYLGETHDQEADHQAQLAIIQALHQHQPKLAIALEMFQRPAQPLLDQYLAGKLTEADLQSRSQFSQRWGFPWEYYAPILRFAREQQLPLIALNTPSEVTRKVARQGLESLTFPERRFIPPASEIRTDNAAYRQMALQVYEEIHQGRTSSSNFERFFLAQVLWDETMAEGIARFAQANPHTLTVVLAGQGHLVYGHGIPSRVARRMGKRPFQQRSLLLNPPPAFRQNRDPAIADYLWVTVD